jgi:hypothetical protein
MTGFRVSPSGYCPEYNEDPWELGPDPSCRFTLLWSHY